MIVGLIILVIALVILILVSISMIQDENNKQRVINALLDKEISKVKEDLNNLRSILQKEVSKDESDS